MGGYDAQLSQIYEALENMLDKKWMKKTSLRNGRTEKESDL